MNRPFSEWTREEKDSFAGERMKEMKLKNEQLKLRHAEVEIDRANAEAKNSSVTSVKGFSARTREEKDAFAGERMKEMKLKNEQLKLRHAILPKQPLVFGRGYEDDDDFSPKPVKEREWDIGKDMGIRDSPKFFRPGCLPKKSTNKRYKEREEFFRIRSAKGNKDSQASFSRFKSSGRSWNNKKFTDNTSKGRKGHEKVKRMSHGNVEYSRQTPSRMHECTCQLRNRGKVEKWLKSLPAGPSNEENLPQLHEKNNEGYYDLPKEGRGNKKQSYIFKGQKGGKVCSKSKFRQESDPSDYASSAKESDYPGYRKQSGKICDNMSLSFEELSAISFSKVDCFMNNDQKYRNNSKVCRPSTKQRKIESHLKNLSSSDYSELCETPVKKQHTKRSSWKRSPS